MIALHRTPSNATVAILAQVTCESFSRLIGGLMIYSRFRICSLIGLLVEQQKLVNVMPVMLSSPPQWTCPGRTLCSLALVQTVYGTSSCDPETLSRQDANSAPPSILHAGDSNNYFWSPLRSGQKPREGALASDFVPAFLPKACDRRKRRFHQAQSCSITRNETHNEAVDGMQSH